MQDEHANAQRRRLLMTALAGIPVVALYPVAGRADELPHVDPESTQARALSYTHDATTVSAEKRGGEDRTCANCQLFTDPEAAQWGPCQLFPGKAVATDGWCVSWVARQS